jgi:predicted O-methyltransferase YrrM
VASDHRLTTWAGAPADDGGARPARVVEAEQRARAAGFTLSSEPDVGGFLACLAASLPERARILELGTGAGFGLAWLVSGLGGRTDVEIVTVDTDEALQRQVRSASWPSYVLFELGDGEVLLPSLGTFDLIFADAPGGKTSGLAVTIEALRPGALLVVDDMDLSRHHEERLRHDLAEVRRRLHGDERLVCAELGFSSGVIVAARQHDVRLR